MGLSFRARLSSTPLKWDISSCAKSRRRGYRRRGFSDALESEPSPLGAPLSVGLIGLGTVGCEVYRRVVASEDLRLVSILVKDAHKKRSVDSSVITTDPSVFFKSGANLIIDCSNPSESLNARLLQALENGVRVVTANKGNLADDLDAWAPWIQQGRVRHSATVGGVISMLETTREEKARSQIQQFRAVLNGTCNYILDRLHAGQSFQDALDEAQALGFAEADPSADIDGFDAARKCSLLAFEAWGQVVDWQGIELEGIRPLTTEDARNATKSGALLRLVAEGRLHEDTVTLSVKPQWVAQGTPESLVEGPMNFLTLHAGGPDSQAQWGRGRGLATAVSVFGDVLSFIGDRRIGSGRFMPILVRDEYDDSNTKARQSRRRGRLTPRPLS